MVDTLVLGTSASCVWVRVPPSVQLGVVAQEECPYDIPMVEQSPEKTCATWFEPRLHHNLGNRGSVE
jgi:hypothetical protein